MKIKAYLKPSCGWSNGVRAIMRKHHLEYEDIDIINVRANYEEMVRKSGQPLSPCVEIDGVMLADISGEEVENYLLANNLVSGQCRPGERRPQCRLFRRGAREDGGQARAFLLSRRVRATNFPARPLGGPFCCGSYSGFRNSVAGVVDPGRPLRHRIRPGSATPATSAT
jgi:glutaredoxin